MEPMDSGVEIYYAKETCENLEGDNIEEHGLKMEMTRWWKQGDEKNWIFENDVLKRKAILRNIRPKQRKKSMYKIKECFFCKSIEFLKFKWRTDRSG